MLLLRKGERDSRSLGYNRVKITVGDGSHGLPTFAPFDAIIVSAAAPGLPHNLLSQFGEGGRMIIPVGTAKASTFSSSECRTESLSSHSARHVALFP